MERKMEQLTSWFHRKSSRNPSMTPPNDGLTIGAVQHFERKIHVEKDDEGALKGLPPDFQQMLESMTTAEERANAQNTETAKQIIIWNKEQEEKNKQKDFIVIGTYKSVSLISYKIL